MRHYREFQHVCVLQPKDYHFAVSEEICAILLDQLNMGDRPPELLGDWIVI